jgi:hypothetical protein
MMQPFRPVANGTLTLSATTSSSRVQVSAVAVPQEYRIYNAGTVAVFIEDGNSAVTANTTADVPIAPGAIEVLTLAGTHVAGITASGTATIYITPGDGN